jgi:hypothetical protein
MTFEADLTTVIKAGAPALGTRVFPKRAPASTARPYCTYEQIGGGVLNMVENVAPGVRNSMMQINVWSNTEMEARALINAIEGALCATTVFSSCRPIAAAVEDDEPELRLYGFRQDFTVWHSD